MCLTSRRSSSLKPGFWLKQQERRDWNRIKLDTFVPVLLGEQAGSAKKGTKKVAAEVVESAGPDANTVGVAKAKTPKTAVVKAAAGKPKPAAKKNAPVTPIGSAGGDDELSALDSASLDAPGVGASEVPATERGADGASSE